jgi:Sulfotransferase family
MAYPLPIDWFGEYWSRSMTTGIAALRNLPDEEWTSIKYEDLLSEPEAELTRLAEFLGVTPLPEWLAAAQRRMHRGSTGRARAYLDPDTFRGLQRACAPGIEAIQNMTKPPGRVW